MDVDTPTRRGGSALLVGVTAFTALALLGTGLWLAVSSTVLAFTSTGVPVSLGPQSPGIIGGGALLPLVDGFTIDGSSGEPAASPDEWTGGEFLPVQHAGGLVLDVWWDEHDPLFALVSSSRTWAGMLAAGGALLVLVPVLRSTAGGRPFAPNNARRLAVATGLVTMGWAVGTALTWTASRWAVEANTAGLPDGWVVPRLEVAWWPATVVALLAALTWATAQGTRLARDTEGLV